MDTLLTLRVEKANDRTLIETSYTANDLNQICNNPNFIRMFSTETTEQTETETPVEYVEPVDEKSEVTLTPFYEKNEEKSIDKVVIGKGKTYRKPRKGTKTTNLFPTKEIWAATSHLKNVYAEHNFTKINFAMFLYAVGKTHSFDKPIIDLNATFEFELPQHLKDQYDPNENKQPVKHTLKDTSRINESICQAIAPNTFSKKELEPSRIRKELTKEAIKYKVQPGDLFNFYVVEGANYLYKNKPDFFQFPDRGWPSLAKKL